MNPIPLICSLFMMLVMIASWFTAKAKCPELFETEEERHERWIKRRKANRDNAIQFLKENKFGECLEDKTTNVTRFIKYCKDDNKKIVVTIPKNVRTHDKACFEFYYLNAIYDTYSCPLDYLYTDKLKYMLSCMQGHIEKYPVPMIKSLTRWQSNYRDQNKNEL